MLALKTKSAVADAGVRRVLDRLTDEDAQILRLGKGVIRGHTCKVIVLERAEGGRLPTLEAIRERVSARLEAAPRFRQRVVYTPLHVANPAWFDDLEFDVARHVTRVPASPELGFAELEELLAGVMTQRLDRAHPLWHIDVVERLATDTMALIWRVHHSLADGTTCVRLASTLLWDQAEIDAVPPTPWHPRAQPASWALLARGLADRATPGSRRRGERPARLTSLRALREVIGRELRPTSSSTPLAADVGPNRTVAFAAAPLEACRRAGKAVDEAITVNDVVLSIIAGAVRTWLGPDESIRVKVPVSLHHRGEGVAVSNHNSYFFVDLPVAEADPRQRLRRISRETRERKLGHDADVLYRLGSHPTLAHLAMSPPVFTFNVSNVRGPDEDVSICGARVRELYSLAEIAPHHALRIAVISAAGCLFFGLCADRDVVKNLRALADGLRRSSEELLALAH